MSNAISFDTIQNHAIEYWNKIPKNTAKVMVTTFAVAFVVDTVLTGNPLVGFVGGILAVTAVAVHSLITPLFKHLIGKGRTELTWAEEMLRTSVAVVGTACLAAVGGYGVVLERIGVTLLVFSVANYFFDNFRNVNKTHCLYL